MKIALWIVQGLLSVSFLMTGVMKIITPYAQLAEQMPWAERSTEGLVLFIGIAEILGAIGLILPSILRLLPKLTPLAAIGLATIMLLAIKEHLTAGEMDMLPANVVLAVMATFVAWGRWFKVPIISKK